MTVTVRQILRARNRENAAKPGDMLEHIAKRITDPLPDLRGRGAHRKVVTLLSALEMLTSLKERRRHRARFVHVEVDLDPITIGSLNHLAKRDQPLVGPLAKLRKDRTRGQLAQDDVKPHAVDAGVGKPLEQSVGIRIEFSIEQRVAENAEVGIQEANRLIPAAFGRRQWFLYITCLHVTKEIEARPSGLVKLATKVRFDQCFDLITTLSNGFVGLGVVQRLASRLERAELDPEKVVLAKCKGQLLSVPAQQGQKLVIRQEVPVPPNDRDVAALLILGRRCYVVRQPHRASNLVDILRRRPKHLSHPRKRNHLPVPPDKRMNPIRKMRKSQRRRRAADRQFISENRPHASQTNGNSKTPSVHVATFRISVQQNTLSVGRDIEEVYMNDGI